MRGKISTLQLAGVAILAWLFLGCAGEDRLDVGADAPDFSVSDATNLSTTVSLKSLRGKVVLIDFWATWCGPCRMSMPHLQHLYHNNVNKGLEVMAISSEDAATVVKFAAQNEYDLPVYVEGSQSASNAFRVGGLPTTAVVGKDGRIAYYMMGFDPNGEAELDAVVDKALKA